MSKAVPNLGDLIRDPSKVAKIPLESLAEMRAELHAVLIRLDTLLLSRLQTTNNAGSNGNGDRLLTAEEAAAKLGMSADWVYGHADDLSPVRIGSGSRKSLRFSERNLERYIQIRSAR